LFLAPRRVFNAFVRGRRSRNLYNGEFEASVLERTVGELRRELAIPQEVPRANAADWLAFGFWAAFSSAFTFGPWAIGAAGAAAAAYWMLA
jgi:hypothetical protein